MSFCFLVITCKQERILTWDLPGKKAATRNPKKIYSMVRLKCSKVEVLWGQLGMFLSRYTVQTAPQTAPDGLMLQT